MNITDDSDVDVRQMLFHKALIEESDEDTPLLLHRGSAHPHHQRRQSEQRHGVLSQGHISSRWSSCAWVGGSSGIMRWPFQWGSMALHNGPFALIGAQPVAGILDDQRHRGFFPAC
jgi:hypothetical protein